MTLRAEDWDALAARIDLRLLDAHRLLLEGVDAHVLLQFAYLLGYADGQDED